MVISETTPNSPVRRVVIVGGGTAGWLTACVLASEFQTSGAFKITVIESPDAPSVGVGEGTWPSMRSTLKKIGLNEAEFLRRCQASLKQGTFFRNWLHGRGESYYHPFSPPAGYSETNLAEVWRQVRGDHESFAHAVTPQCRVCDQAAAPKQLGVPDFAYVLNYGFHRDAGGFAHMLTDRATEALGGQHIREHISRVVHDPEGYLTSLVTRSGTEVAGDIFIDCSGFQALLVEKHYKIPLERVTSVLFNDSAVAAQIPYGDSTDDIRSTTWATAQPAGWIWDIGLRDRRGVGMVFSSAHTNEAEAHERLHSYVESTNRRDQVETALAEARLIQFTPGYRKTPWHKNCIAVGLSSGFVEPLEASALVMVELAARALADRFPTERSVMPQLASRFNREFNQRWEHIVEFLKLHYVLSQRDDSDYWRDHRNGNSIPDSLIERLALWHTGLPWHPDDQRADELFPSASYQYVLMGMDFQTTASPLPRRGREEQMTQAQTLFREVREQGQRMSTRLSSNRQLLSELRQRDFAAL